MSFSLTLSIHPVGAGLTFLEVDVVAIGLDHVVGCLIVSFSTLES